MDDILPVVPLGDHGVVEQRDELQLGQADQRLEVRQLLINIKDHNHATRMLRLLTGKLAHADVWTEQ